MCFFAVAEKLTLKVLPTMSDMMHQYKPVSASESLADWITCPIITVSETVKEATRVENGQVGLKNRKDEQER